MAPLGDLDAPTRKGSSRRPPPSDRSAVWDYGLSNIQRPLGRALASTTSSPPGSVCTYTIIEVPSELTGTEWGRILLLKTAAVAIAAGGGAYNHFRLLPALDAAPDDEELAAELRSTVTAEAIMLAFVVALTAWLVAAAS